MYKRILVPVDGSDASDLGVREAVALARDQQASLRFVHVVDERALTMELSVGADFERLRALLRERGDEVLDNAKQLADKREVACETTLRETLDLHVAGMILTEARDWPCDLIVMGTHGRRGMRHLVMGSDAETVLRSSPVPVLLVRLKDD